jgi:hypothetical protein
VALGSDAIERAEANQPIPAANIEDDVAGLERGSVEDAIASPLQVFDELGRRLGASLATLSNPERPAVFRRRDSGV